ncbi:MAG: YbhB/YbcL family Raf kinase inhibitor-like protein [Deltaproteobacteria bacterium]|nr:YbhB/YbcL family Raf kinase inhibitor-like protein [Deltaproteobacteria bacterium]
MKIESSAFEHNQKIPSKYTCDGHDLNPPLKFLDVPQEAKSLVLIMDDPDAPVGTWDHWLIWNIDPKVSDILENAVPQGAVEGTQSWDHTGYGGPCPPSGTHRYFFKLYALDTKLDLSKSSRKKDVESAMKGHVLSSAELIGLYSRVKK